MNSRSILPSLILVLLSTLFSTQSLAQADNRLGLEAADEATAVDAEELAYREWAADFEASLSRQTGRVALPGGIASLDVPENFYYLSPADSKRVLEQAWGNPESELGLGMLFPARYSPLDDASWGVTIDYESDGYVSDEDAADIDYGELLRDMQADTQEESKLRVESGYESIALMGWAAQPYYDSANHKLYWAQELQFGGMDERTLNYNVRVLGRQGVLLMNFIASMPQLSEVESHRDEVLAMTQFNVGNRYSEFDPDIDTVAAYGIGGLVAGKVMAKAGLLATGLILLKKFWFFLFLPLIWLKNKIFKKDGV